MTTYTLRPATDHDFDFLFGLHQAAMGQYIESIWGWHDDWQREYFRRKFNAPQRQIIQIAGQDAGVLVVEARPDELYLNLIELLPKYQAQGVGSAIVGLLLAQARATGVPYVARTEEQRVRPAASTSASACELSRKRKCAIA